MKHAYWCVICKTKTPHECGNLIAAHYIGPQEGHFAYELPEYGPGSWEIECGKCRKPHRYTRDDLQVKALDAPPPSGFRGWSGW